MKKRIFPLTLCVCLLCMLMSGLTLSVSAEPEVNAESDFAFNEEDDGIVIFGLQSTVTDKTIVVPAKINGKNVICIYLNNFGLESLDISRNTELRVLVCCNNHLTSLNTENNTKLEMLEFSSNYISSLDLSKNTELKDVTCDANNLTSLKTDINTKLQQISCGLNKISSLDLSKNTELTTLICGNNNFTSLNIEKNTKLTLLCCSENAISSLDLSNNIQLKYVFCENNKLTRLDISHNVNLEYLACYDNYIVDTSALIAWGDVEGHDLELTPQGTITSVTGIIMTNSTSFTAGTSLSLTATVGPDTATFKDVVWSVKDAGTTGATITGNKLSATKAGTVTVTATVNAGKSDGTAFTKDFTITVKAAPVVTEVKPTVNPETDAFKVVIIIGACLVASASLLFLKFKKSLSK